MRQVPCALLGQAIHPNEGGMILGGDPDDLRKLGITPGEPMTEAQIQRAVFQQLKARAPKGALFWPVPNNPAARRTVGFVPGVSDVHCLHKGELFTLELKTEKGRASLEQMEWTAKVNEAKGYGFISHGYDAALACLKGWGLLR